MPGLRGLTIVVADDDAERLRTALVMALAQAALGGAVGMFLQGEAVRLIRLPIEAPRDPANAAAGLPTLAALVEDALTSGITLTACQSGLALIGSEAKQFDPRIGWGGMVNILAELGEDRLVIA
jgi:predicted peroxiredoxin